MQPKGIKPHTHAERTAMIEQLIPLWQQKFGDNLLGIAACASYGRGEDQLYSDLEMELFVKQLPEGEPAHYQRVVDGMLIEVLYRTPEQYLLERWQIAPHWRPRLPPTGWCRYTIPSSSSGSIARRSSRITMQRITWQPRQKSATSCRSAPPRC